MFMKHQVDSDFEVTKRIVDAIDSDMSDDDTRELIFSLLRANGMTEEDYENEEEKIELIVNTEPKEQPAVFEEFKIQIQDRNYVIRYYMN